MRKSVKRLLQIKKLKSMKIPNAPSLHKFLPNLSTKQRRKASGHSFTNKLRKRESCKTKQQKRLNGRRHRKNANSPLRSMRLTWKELWQQKWKFLSVNLREINQSIFSTSCNLPLGHLNLQFQQARWSRNSKLNKRANQSAEFKSWQARCNRLKKEHHWKSRLLSEMSHRFLVSLQAQKS